MSYNYVSFSGHMVDAPKFKEGDKPEHDRAWFVLAHNPNTKREDVKPVFMACVAWGNAARIASKYGKKGKGWGVEGALKTQPKQAADGTKYTYCEIVVRRHEMLQDSKKDRDAQIAAEAANEQAPSEQGQDVSKVLAQLAELKLSPEQIAAVIATAGEPAQSQENDRPF